MLVAIREKFQGGHFISLNDYNKEELVYMLDIADFLKKRKKNGYKIDYLPGKTLGMIFQKSSTRTRVSFETGIYYLGGIGLFLSSSDLQIGRGEPVADTARTLSRYLDGIMIRTFAHQEVLDLARFGSVPVINALTDLLHPCQILADVQTIREHKGRLNNLKLVFVGDGNNVCHSLLYAAAIFGYDMVVACPKGYEPDTAVWNQALARAAGSGAKLSIAHQPLCAAKDADVIYTDVWASMGMEAEAKARDEAFLGFQVNDELMRCAKPDAMVMHCLPAKREKEITAAVFEAHAGEIFDEAENRLYAQMAVMILLMADATQKARLDKDMLEG